MKNADIYLTNGTAAVHDVAADWRRAAMTDALRAASEDGTPLYALLSAVQRHLPGHTARVFWENRVRTLDALGRRLSDLAPCLTPAVRKSDDEAALAYPVLGWWRGTDAATGDAYEVLLAPDFHGEGDWLVAGPDADRLDALVDAALADATRNTCRCLRYAGGEWQDAPEMQAEVDKTTWDHIVLDPALLADVRRTIDVFFTQKATLATLGFPWRRGVLLVGPPGTGKTMVCKAAAATHPEVPFLYVRDLRTCRDGIAEIFARARKLAPCILAFEDVDGLINKENRTVFLNELDGFRNNDGLLIIASSNHPGQIDEALLKRPSRFDRVYHIGLPAVSERAEFFRRLLARTPELAAGFDSEAVCTAIAERTDGFTPAYLKEAFLSARLQMAQEGLTTLDESFGVALLEQVEALRGYLRKVKNPEALGDFVSANGTEIGFRSR
jgi:hypothetical protein